MSARENEERGKGVPFTEEERAQKHFEEYGTKNLPPRGTGLGRIPGLGGLGGFELQSMKVLKGMGNPGITTSTPDIIGLIAGGALGFYLAKRWPNMMIKGIGVIIGAELGIIAARLIGRREVMP